MNKTRIESMTIARPTSDSKLHLYLAWGCPFCHRVIAALTLAGLNEQVTITWMANIKGSEGWQIRAGDDPLFAATSLRTVYEALGATKDSRPSVPLLVDISTRELLSTSSSAITRFFVRGMQGAYPVNLDLTPVHLVAKIDSTNAWLHDNVNRAVYAVGFASKQRDYETKVERLFQSLDELDQLTSDRFFLFGDAITESDLYLLATLVRFDTIYYPLFRCSYRRIADYPGLSAYLDRLLSIDGISSTFDHALNKQHYYCGVMHVGDEVLEFNPSRLVPVDSQIYKPSEISALS